MRLALHLALRTLPAGRASPVGRASAGATFACHDSRPMNDQHRDPDAAGVPTLLAGRYRIISPLGSGGMADVYLAEDERLSRRVAVKVLKARLAADDEFVERFRIEAQAAASLNHSSIVAVYDRGSADDVTYIAMEYVAGESLKQRLRRDGALPPDEAVAVALAVLSALGAAHARHIVHRDVTSYNVMLAEDGRVVVTDFGIARMGDSALTRTGAMMGTSSYLSPEQAQGRPADERSDLYSLGVVLYEMLTGRVPFKGESDVAVAMQHVQTAPPNPRTLTPAVSEALAATVMRALSKDPADRFQDAEEFAAALRRARRPARNGRGVSVAVGEGAGHGTLAAAGVAAAAGAGAAAGASVLGAVAAPPAPARVAFTAAPQAPAPPAATPPAPAPPADGAEPLVTVVVAEAPTRYHSAEPATTVRPRPRRRIRRYLLLALLVLVVAAAGWVAYITWLAPGTAVPGLVGERRTDAVQALRDGGLKPALHYVWSDKYADGRGRPPGAARRPAGGRRCQGGPLGESRSAPPAGPRSLRLDRHGGQGHARGRVAHLQEPPVRLGERAQGAGVPPEAGRRSDGAAGRHGHVLGEQRAAQGVRARRGRPLAGRRPGSTRG